MFPLFNTALIAAIFAGLVMFGLIFYFWQTRMEVKARAEVKKRLEINKPPRRPGIDGRPMATAAAGKVASKMASNSASFYSKNDPEQKRMMQMRLIQAGYPNPGALGYFFSARFVSAGVFIILGILFAYFLTPDQAAGNKAIEVMLFAILGYYIPNLYIRNRIKTRQVENRAGFPDVMDLMVVAAEAGLTTEASIERIAGEIERTHPILSEQLHLAAIEIRAGKQLDEALRDFGQRVGLEEVQGFATMIQQSKELGTSVSDALRVYSDEMRHKRMMAAEEKAYALPAKLSIPVTAFILPIVIGVAIIPTVVRMMAL